MSAAALFPLLLAGAFAPAAAAEPFRLDDWIPGDEISLEATHRLRFERLWNQFRPLEAGSPPRPTRRNDDALLLRTLVHARYQPVEWLAFGAELQDSRALTGEDRGFIATTVVNPVELLQAYAELDFADVAGGRFTAKAGRLTMDMGKRRIVARNRFRNTINGFTGLDVRWERDDRVLRGFWTLPVVRRPFAGDDLRDNEIHFDREALDFQFWGVFGSTPLPWDSTGELYVVGLHSDRNRNPPRRRRQLYTPGFRVFRRASPGVLDYEIEAMYQAGESRQGSSGAGDLQHRAWFYHLEVGYTLDAPWRPRVLLQYDHASGDEDPTDGDNERFDTLFGARRFDFGPTSIFGAFARSNIRSPSLRVQVKPMKNVSAFTALRGFWLDEKRGFWAGGLNQDVTGDAGRHIGTQLEFRVRWDILPKNLRLEAGYAHIFAGEFIDDAPTSPSRGDVDYAYTQVVLGY